MNDTNTICTREENILNLADQLLKATIELDEAIIDSQFLFRFDLSWYRWVCRIRGIVWLLVTDQESQKPLSIENNLHLRWVMHIEDNFGISVGWDSSRGLIIENTIKSKNGYDPFNKELSKQLWEIRDNKKAGNQIWAKMWGEANQISKIHNEIIRLGRAFGLIPSSYELDDYSSNQTTDLHARIFNWVMWGQIAPVFRWPMTQLLENKFQGVVRLTHPHRLPEGYWRDLLDGGRVWIEKKVGNTKRMTHSVRIRTWTVYYLTRRGGGEQTEQAAVDLWNRTFPDQSPGNGLAIKHFRRERRNLFIKGSKKNAPNDDLHIGLSYWDKN